MTQQPESVFKRTLLAPLFLWLKNANQIYARVDQSVSRSLLTSDECYYPNAMKVKIESMTGEMLNLFEVQALSIDDIKYCIEQSC